MVVDGGHEVGTHGYSHENPVSMTPQQERDVIDKCVGLVEDLIGKKPAGNSAPWWEPSDATNEILLEYGYKYDRSLQHNDFTPYWARKGDQWTPIDYSQPASEWMKPLVRGEEIDLVKIPPNWYLDDLPPMMFIKANPNSHGFMNPRDIEDLWRDQFDWVYREMDYAVYAPTVHPDVSGRPQNLLMLERLIGYINAHEGVRWVTLEQIAEDFRERQPRGEARKRRGPGTPVKTRAGGDRSLCVSSAESSSPRPIGRRNTPTTKPALRLTPGQRTRAGATGVRSAPGGRP